MQAIEPRPAAIGQGSVSQYTQKRIAVLSARQTCRAVAVAVPEAAAIASSSSAAQEVGGFFAPPVVSDNQEQLLRQKVPFLTTHAGALPVKPLNLNHALSMYGR